MHRRATLGLLPGREAMPVETVKLTGNAKFGLAPQFVAAAPLGPLTVRLGRRRPKARPMALQFASYVEPALLAAIPLSCDYATKAMSALSRMYMNDQYGCCVIAGKAHTVGTWTGNDTPSAVQATDDEIYRTYQSICRPGDHG